MHPSRLFVVCCLVSSGLQAATLTDITENALARSPDVLSRMHDYLSSGYEQQAAKGAWQPRLDLEAYTGRERYNSPTSNPAYFNHPGSSLQLRQLLFDGGAVSGEIRRSGFAKVSRYYDFLQTTDDIALQAAQAYIDVLRYRQLSRQAQDNWAIHKEISDQIASRVKAGVGRRVDLEQAGGRLALAQSNWLTETSNLHDVSARFERIVGETPPTLTDAPDFSKILPMEKEVLPTALKSNPGFLAAVFNLRAAKAQTDVRRAANAPTVEFRASADADRNRQGVHGSYNSAVAQVVMNYNLYRGGSDSARARQAAEAYNSARETREKVCRDVRQITTIAWNDVRKLGEQLNYLEQHLLSTEKARDAYRQQFDIGQRSLLDLLDTENELFEARRALTRAQFDLRLAEYRVLAATHGLLPALGLSQATPAPTEAETDTGEDGAVRCNTEMPPYMPLDTRAALANRPPRVDTPLSPPTPTPSVPAQCEFAANDWAAAWSAKDLERYLGYYSEHFMPQTRADREDWKRFRAQRLNKESISVRLESLAVKQLGPDSCEVNFNQSYRSNDYSDDVTKRLVLKLEGKTWKIIQEIAPGKSTTN